MEVAIQLLAFATFVSLAVLFGVVLRRAGRVLADTREIEAFRRAADDLSERAAASIDGVAARIDAVRRHTLAAEAIEENLAAAMDAVERYTAEALGLPGPTAAGEIRDAIVAELERAHRALEMTEHGRSILASARVGGREIEAQTSIKRGYLNLLHAREAILAHAARAEALRPPPTDVGLFPRAPG